MITDRTLRAFADAAWNRQATWSPAKQAFHRTLLRVGTLLLARFGTASISFKSLAAAFAIGPARLRQHFIDLDSLLAEILRLHLQALAAALSETPPPGYDKAAARRQLYLCHTRETSDTLTPAHLLWVRDRHLLPPDLLAPLEKTHAALAATLAPAAADQAATLALLDAPGTTRDNVERLLAQPKPAAPATARPVQPPAAAAIATNLLRQAEPARSCAHALAPPRKDLSGPREGSKQSLLAQTHRPPPANPNRTTPASFFAEKEEAYRQTLASIQSQIAALKSVPLNRAIS